ncbi:hypothetical protein ACFYO0_40720 [Streptomyces sp. NPDC006365]|uniref:hypothetical protein n=1 Tax=Streptomyces sp. NPDC006365 TaxID=3364744 RepID=UPI0036A38FAB
MRFMYVMSVVLAIAAKDLRQRLRDKSAWIMVFLAPVVISGLMAMAMALSSSSESRADLAITDLDHGPAATALVTTFKSPRRPKNVS